jgi:hypothetical protein
MDIGNSGSMSAASKKKNGLRVPPPSPDVSSTPVASATRSLFHAVASNKKDALSVLELLVAKGADINAGATLARTSRR